MFVVNVYYCLKMLAVKNITVKKRKHILVFKSAFKGHLFTALV